MTEIDEFVESTRKSTGRPAVTIGILELDENDQIKQKYANAFGKIDPVCDEKQKICEKVKIKKKFFFCFKFFKNHFNLNSNKIKILSKI